MLNKEKNMAWAIGFKREDKNELTLTTPQVSVIAAEKIEYFDNGAIKSEEKSIKIEGNPSHVPEVANKLIGGSRSLLNYNNSDHNSKKAKSG